MDAYIVKVQNWLNGTYGSDSRFEMLPVTGETGWTTIYGLTRALQIELDFCKHPDFPNSENPRKQRRHTG